VGGEGVRVLVAEGDVVQPVADEGGQRAVPVAGDGARVLVAGSRVMQPVADDGVRLLVAAEAHKPAESEQESERMSERAPEPGQFASSSLPRHLARGFIGFGSIVAGLALIPLIGIAALLLVPVGLLALRGCPMCWTMGLIQTISAGRVRRECVDGRCELRVPGRDSQG